MEIFETLLGLEPYYKNHYEMTAVTGLDQIAFSIITRFSLKFGSWTEKIGIRTEDEMIAWSENRVHLFETYCMPSVLAQAEHIDKWYILFDQKTTKPIDQMIERLRAFDFIEPVLLDSESIGVHNAIIETAKIMARDFSGAYDFISTTRLDSDDALSRLFFPVYRHYLSYFPMEDIGRGRAFNYPIGAQTDTKTFRLRVANQGPFLSLIEPFAAFRNTANAGGGTSVYKSDHTKMSALHPVHNIHTTRPMWLQVIHDQNVGNRFLENGLALSDNAFFQDLFWPRPVADLSLKEQT